MAKVVRKSKEERENEICSAAKYMFLEKGFKQTTMEDVIEKTTLSKGGVYRYFKSTREIMIYWLSNFAENELKKVQKVTETSEKIPTRDKYKEAIVGHFLCEVLDFSDDRKLLKMFMSEIANDNEFKEIYLKMEGKQIKLFFEILGIDERFENQGVFLFRAHFGFSHMSHLFEFRPLYEDNIDLLRKVYNLLYDDLYDKCMGE